MSGYIWNLLRKSDTNPPINDAVAFIEFETLSLQWFLEVYLTGTDSAKYSENFQGDFYFDRHKVPFQNIPLMCDWKAC